MLKKKYSQGDGSTEFFVTILVVCVLLGIVAGKFAGWKLGMSVGLGLPSVIILIGVLGVYGERKAYQAECRLIEEIERAFPDGRAKRLSTGKWLISSRQTGEIIDEISWSSK